MKQIVVLTSSRADYGIYRPLLHQIQTHQALSLKVIAFGTHLSTFHGYTLKQIKTDGFPIWYTVESLIAGDSPEAISTAMGLTSMKFASIWAKERQNIDLIICLGDRYEMFAAVSAAIAFNLPIAHLHGGETTLGAIDNTFRHCLTLMAQYHFCATPTYADRIAQIIGNNQHIYPVGALSLDNLNQLELLDTKQFLEQFHIDLTIPTILTTFHPETVSFEQNRIYAQELVKALTQLSERYQIIITMPNADTMGNQIRQILKPFIERNEQVIGVESFGVLGYFSCMQHCSFLLGNTSSGIIEAASFEKYVINLGDRQKGRATSGNVVHCAVEVNAILSVVQQLEQLSSIKYEGENSYWQGGAVGSIVKVLEEIC